MKSRSSAWAQKTLAKKLATLWFVLFFTTIALFVVGALLGAIVYAHIDLGFYHALPLTIRIVVFSLSLWAYLVLEY